MLIIATEAATPNSAVVLFFVSDSGSVAVKQDFYCGSTKRKPEALATESIGSVWYRRNVTSMIGEAKRAASHKYRTPTRRGSVFVDLL